jgi:thiosulfate/3-mercaptopyruvate sulfurtransferase
MMSTHEFVIDPEELSGLLDSPGLRLFDATVLFRGEERTARDDYLEAHIPGAAFLDHQAISDPDAPYMFMLPDEARLTESIGALGISADDLVVLYSTETLMWATRAFWVLRHAGHDRVRILNGGLAAWRENGGAIEAGERTYTAAQFEGVLRPEMIVGRDDVEAAIGREDVCTINALPPALYEGTDAVPYAAEGHITGSTNKPYSEIAPDERYPDLDAVRTALKDGGYLGPERVLSYCGGGISATVSAVGCLMVGKSDVAVYDGSLSEWVAQGGSTTKGAEPGALD